MTPFIDTHHAQATLDDGVATLTLTNAKSMNILGTPAILELTAALDALRARGDVRVLVLRGSGDKAFLGGADIHEMSNLSPPTAEDFITRLGALCESVRTFPAPTIARLAGWTLGGGLEVALACDLRLSSTAAHYGMPEVAVGVPSVIHAVLLPRLIGGSRAAWMLMTGESIDAATAHAWGLVHEIHDGAALDARIGALARKLAGLGPQVLRQQKRLLRSWESQTPEAAIAATIPEFGRAFATGEPQHYMGAFKNRRR
ncbi:MAG: enoyl-CoA hydratase/isomerase family protein [Burkholderiales bacterium]|nr:enoyl-CoA hydratase/isomerase family protein [Burkholderiales bacterium]